VVTVRAEMSRLRRTLGSVLEARPYRIAPAVRASVLLPARGAAIEGSSAPVVSATRTHVRGPGAVRDGVRLR